MDRTLVHRGRLRNGVSLLLTALVVALSGCVTSRIENPPLAQFEPSRGYGHKLRENPNAGKLKIVMAFSGGGTRAAALSYGVLQELRETRVSLGNAPSRLLDDVVTISSVSGGSFTSAYYGLYGDRIFEDYEERFLRKDIQGKLVANLLRPLVWLRLMLTPATRSDRAAEIYDKHVFDGATFADLQAAEGPIVNINATDLDASAIVTFVQPEFDAICSDLSPMRVSLAVTASSAVPGAFAPITIQNRAGSCGFQRPEWINEALANPQANRRRYHDARIAAGYLDADKRKYLHLVDGGIADNIGARKLIHDVTTAGGWRALVKERGAELPDRIVYVIVNAQAGGKHGWVNSPNVPGLGAVLGAISGAGIYRYNFETVELLRESVVQWSDEVAKEGKRVTPYVIEVAFENLPDQEERAFFENVATSFDLDDETVDRLIEVAGRLLRETSEYQQLLADVGGEVPAGR